MKKKVLALIIVLALTIAFAACSSDAATTGTTQTTGTPSQSSGPAAAPASAETESSGEVTPDFDWLKGQTIHLVLGYTAGGSLDVMLRQICAIWQEYAGCTFVIENREGATGQVAAQYVLSRPQDGTTILGYTETYQSNMYIANNPGFGIDDFALLNMQVVDSATLTVLKDSPYQTIEQLLDAMRENPGQIVCSALTGGAGNIWLQMLKDVYGLDFKVVYYDGGANMRTAMLGKHGDFMTGTASGDLGLGDEALPLVVAGSERNAIWPDTPCSEEVMPDLGIPASLGSSRIIATTREFKENYPERFLALLETYRQALESDEYQTIIKATGEDAVTHFYGPDKSDELQRGVYNLCLEYKDVFAIG